MKAMKAKSAAAAPAAAAAAVALMALLIAALTLPSVQAGFIKRANSGPEENYRAIFEACDRDHNGFIVLSEFEKCMTTTAPTSSTGTTPLNKPVLAGLDPTKFMVLVDGDRDGKVSWTEFHRVLERAHEAGESPEVEVRRKNGKVETISLDELADMSESSLPSEFTMKDGNMVKEKTGTMRRDELNQNNHQDVSAFLFFGEWAHRELMRTGQGYGTISQVRSLPHGGSVNRGLEDTVPIDKSKNYTQWIEMSILDSNEQLKFYELEIERDKEKYRKPYYALLRIWELDETGARQQSIPAPPASLRVVTYGLWRMVELVFLYLLVPLIIGVIIFLRKH